MEQAVAANLHKMLTKDRRYRATPQASCVLKDLKRYEPVDMKTCFLNYSRRRRPTQTLQVRWIPTAEGSRIGVKDVRQLKESVAEHAPRRLLVITVAPLTLFAKRELLDPPPGTSAVEHWLYSELLHDPFEHALFQNQRIISKKNAAAQDLQLKHLPKMLREDRVARTLGATRGQVVRIERNHPNGFVYVVYRAVV